MEKGSQERKGVYLNAIQAWGVEAQFLMLMEETGELLQAAAQWRRGRVDRHTVLGEIADLRIMLEQLEVMLGHDVGDSDGQMCGKIDRLKSRLRENQ